MIFSKKEKPLVAHTIEKCLQCKKENKRPFKEGDTLFTQGQVCTSCKDQTSILKIFGQAIE
jgi:hypothetical protein